MSRLPLHGSDAPPPCSVQEADHRAGEEGEEAAHWKSEKQIFNTAPGKKCATRASTGQAIAFALLLNRSQIQVAVGQGLALRGRQGLKRVRAAAVGRSKGASANVSRGRGSAGAPAQKSRRSTLPADGAVRAGEPNTRPGEGEAGLESTRSDSRALTSRSYAGCPGDCAKLRLKFNFFLKHGERGWKRDETKKAAFPHHTPTSPLRPPRPSSRHAPPPLTPPCAFPPFSPSSPPRLQPPLQRLPPQWAGPVRVKHGGERERERGGVANWLRLRLDRQMEGGDARKTVPAPRRPGITTTPKTMRMCVCVCHSTPRAAGAVRERPQRPGKGGAS